ncbi:hypothetical protein [Jeotgalibacillus aurantiacus]|uniref:hypothetical protein n=1 Tax=Jeotgalibacillus aurantiacus TaxID=2763266 RepID=UPI001D09EF31|nr:hypothetical protein [Jeotgalibacillus aurantiacus]
MKRMLFFILCLGLAGCTQLDENAETAQQHLIDLGYDVKSYEGSQAYSFTKGDLGNMPHNYIWAVQSTSPEPYFGEEITQQIFLVEDHPLNEVYSDQEGFGDKVEVRIFMLNDQIIGGTSSPTGEGISGSAHSIDGRTPEEVQGENLNELLREWEEGR